jgi:tetratricopeptide (TPR) repeat protein
MFVQIFKTLKDTYVVRRELFIKQMLILLSNPDENGAFLFGQPCIGKTSALDALCAFINNERVNIPVYIDPQTFDDKSLEAIVSEIMLCVSAALECNFDISKNPVNDFNNSFLPMIHDNLKLNQRLVVCIDEFYPHDDSSQAVHPFYLWLKSILPELKGEIFFILTGGRLSSDITDIYLPFFSGFRLFHLAPMSFDETTAMVRYVERNNSIQWPEKIIGEIHEFSGGYPLIIEAVCREFRNLPYASSPDQTFSGVMLRYDKTLKLIWKSLTIEQKLVAACLAESDKHLSQWQIEQRLDETRTSLFYERMKQALQMLEISQVISQNKDGYIIHCAFFSSWICRNHPVNMIVKNLDTLPLVSDYLYQAASYLFQSDRIDDSLKVGQHIIRIHPRHIEANQMVADILIAQDHCIQAQKILDQLYTIKPDAARSRLIHALKIQADSLEALYAYSIDDYRHSITNAHLKNIKLRYADPKDQNNHLLIVYERILELDPDAHDIHEKYIQLILKHQKVKDFQRKIAYEKDILSHELNAYLLTEATNKVKQIQNRILFSQIYLKGLDALLSGQSQNASDLFLRVYYMDEKCKDAKRFLYLSRHFSDEIQRSIKESLKAKKQPDKVLSEEQFENETEVVQLSVKSTYKSNLLLWIFLFMLIVVAIYVMMDGSLK